MHAEIDKLAQFVAQAYRTLSDGLAGLYNHWTPSNRPIYPIIVTLEEWYYFGPTTAERIHSHLIEAFAKDDLDPGLLERFPFTVCSVADFERLMALVAIVGIHPVMKEKTAPERRHWLVHTALIDAFREQYAETRQSLFPNALDGITGEAA